MKQFGIIGKPLGHSFSEQYFTDIFVREGIDAKYQPYELNNINEVEILLEKLDGFNVTYPYKETILPYLQELDPVAKQIGAVNVVSHGKGYNTDWLGFMNSIHDLPQQHQRALLLGTGGVSKAIQYALEQMNIEYTLVGRTRREHVITYEDLSESVMAAHSLIINCTPLGMHPFEKEKPNIPYHWLNEKHTLYDCIYNPEKTLFLLEGEQRGCTIKNGLEMLHRQADQAKIIFAV